MKSINKNVVISSMYLLHNITDTPITVRLVNDDRSYEYVIEPSNVSAIPNDLVLEETNL